MQPPIAVPSPPLTPVGPVLTLTVWEGAKGRPGKGTSLKRSVHIFPGPGRMGVRLRHVGGSQRPCLKRRWEPARPVVSSLLQFGLFPEALAADSPCVFVPSP